jgi:hypothetical protein
MGLKKKKKTLVLTLGRSGAYTANPPEKGEKKKQNKTKKTLGLTLGSPPEKGGEKKKTLVLTLGRSGAYTANLSEKGEKKKKNLGQPAGKGRKKYLVGARDLRTL